MINLRWRHCNINCSQDGRFCASGAGAVFIDVSRGQRDGITGALTMYNRAEMGSAYLSRLGLPMPTLDERVAYLEGRLEEQSSSVDRLRQDIRELRDRLESRMDGFDAKLSRQFTWLVGIQIVMFIAMMTAIGNR